MCALLDEQLPTPLGGLPQFQGVATSGAGRAVISCQPTASTNATTYTLWGPTSASSSKIDQIGSGGLFGTAWTSSNIIRVGGTYETA